VAGRSSLTVLANSASSHIHQSPPKRLWTRRTPHDEAEQTYYRWRNQFGGMKAEDVKRLKELEAENQRLKRIVADQVLENQALKEIAKGNW
jgi:hypothetical protein